MYHGRVSVESAVRLASVDVYVNHSVGSVGSVGLMVYVVRHILGRLLQCKWGLVEGMAGGAWFPWYCSLFQVVASIGRTTLCRFGVGTASVVLVACFLDDLGWLHLRLLSLFFWLQV